MNVKHFLILLIGLFLITSYPDYSEARGARRSGDVSVRGYTRKDGTYVRPHHRSAPDGNFDNNWSTRGNVNPYTGKIGTLDRPNYSRYGRRTYGHSYNSNRSPRSNYPSSGYYSGQESSFSSGLPGASWYQDESGAVYVPKSTETNSSNPVPSALGYSVKYNSAAQLGTSSVNPSSLSPSYSTLPSVCKGATRSSIKPVFVPTETNSQNQVISNCGSTGWCYITNMPDGRRIESSNPTTDISYPPKGIPVNYVDANSMEPQTGVVITDGEFECQQQLPSLTITNNQFE